MICIKLDIFFLNFITWQRNSESPYSSSKLIRHPRWDFFAPVNSTGLGVPPPPSTGRLQLLCQCFFQAHARIDPKTQQLIGDICTGRYTLAPRPPGVCACISRNSKHIRVCVHACFLTHFECMLSVLIKTHSKYEYMHAHIIWHPLSALSPVTRSWAQSYCAYKYYY